MLKLDKDHTSIKTLITGILFCPLVYSVSFFDGFNISKIFLFSTLVILLCISLILKKEFWDSEQISLYPIYLSILLFSVFEIFYSLILSPGLMKNVFFLTDVLVVMYFSALFKILKKIELHYFLLYLCVILLVGCLLIGLLQAANVYPSYSDYFKITGTFLNPGPFACLISVLLVIPITALFFKKKSLSDKGFILSKDQFEPLLVALILFGALILVLTNVRASWLSVIIVVLVLFFNKIFSKKEGFFKRYFVVLIGISLSILLMLGFLFKKDSTLGRLLIWKVSVVNGSNNILFGNGYEYFEHKYNTLQSAYFSVRDDPSSSEAKLAGNVSYAYNEWIEIFTNYGIVGVIFCLLLICYIARSYYKNYRSDSLIYHIAFYVLLAIFIESLVSYPFSMLANKILFATFLAIFLNHDVALKSRSILILPSKIFLIFRLVVLLIVGIIGTLVIKNIFAYRAWREADRQWSIYKNYSACLTILSDQGEILNSNGAFLAYYGRILFFNGNYASSIETLEKAKSYSSDPLVFHTLGQNYSKLKRNTESEVNFKMAINVSPNRLYPRYLLLLHYINSKKSSEAISVARMIMSLQEKIISPATIEIKKKAEDYLESVKEIY